jgi:hypothetical protein
VEDQFTDFLNTPEWPEPAWRILRRLLGIFHCSGAFSMSDGMTITFFNNVEDNVPNVCEMSFADLAETLAVASMVRQKRRAKESIMCVVPAVFDPPKRLKENVTARFAFTGDVDGDKPGDPGFDGMRQLLDALGFAYILHTTTKSTIHTNRYRVILPFSEPQSREAYEEACSSINQMLGEVFDTKTFDASRLSIVPCDWYGAPEGMADWWSDADAHHGYACNVDGAVLDAQAVAEAFPPVIRPVEPAPAPFDLEAYRLANPMADVDTSALMDFDTSPLVTEKMVSNYLTAPAGGRFFSFLCGAAHQALRKNLPCDPSIVFALGQTMNSRGPNPQRRSMREARRAVEHVARNFVAPQSNATNGSAYEQLKKAMKDKKRWQ